MSEPTSSSPAHLRFEIKHRLGALDLDAAFQLTQPWTVLFGPSGSGKSTILRAVAGLIQPDHAEIRARWHGQEQVMTDSQTRVFVAAHKRFVRWAGQRPALFPHMTIRENLRFAAGSLSDPRNIEAAIERFRLAKVIDAKPDTLSGGEQQRVSIARAALAADGRLLLLDEPFNGLDVTLRDELLNDLQTWLAATQTPVFSVTHDIAEAFQLGAEVIKLREGRVVEQGHAAVVLGEERSRMLSQLHVD